MGRLNKLLEDGRLPIFVPFIKEWIFGDSDVAKVIRRNKTTTILLIVNILLLILFFYMAEQAIEKHKVVLEKNKEIQRLQAKLSQIKAINGLDTTDPEKFADQVLKMDQDFRQCKIANAYLQRRIDDHSKDVISQFFPKNCK